MSFVNKDISWFSFSSEISTWPNSAFLDLPNLLSPIKADLTNSTSDSSSNWIENENTWPFEIDSKNKKIIVRVSGPGNLFVEDYLPYQGESEWLEIDSNEITYFLADHQDKLDTIEIMYE